jgi:hypothetical protein
MAEKKQYRRWYDKDPILREALELLRLQSEEGNAEETSEFIIKLQQDVAKEVIDSVYNMVTKYAGKGNRWYDNDPVMLKAVELLRVAPPETQRTAALKLLTALEMNNSDELAETTDNE